VKVRVDFVGSDGMTPIEPARRKISGISKRRRGRGVAKVGVREMRVRVQSGFVRGEPHTKKKFHVFFEEALGAEATRVWGSERLSSECREDVRAVAT
jgi:hypothetical protein